SVLPPGEQKPDSRYSKGTPGVPLYCYYESSDGKSWTRRKLGIFDWGGSRSNNILAADGGTVFIDPSGPASERYKWVAESWYPSELFEAFRAKRPDAWEFRSGQSSSGAAFGMKGAVSPDGLRWSILPEPLVMEASDTQNVAYYDTALGKYVLYIRMWSVGPRSPRVPADAERTWSRIGRRAIGRAET